MYDLQENSDILVISNIKPKQIPDMLNDYSLKS